VLEVADAFARAAAAGVRPHRTVVFALWNAEERGLLGSTYYVRHPVPAGRVVANVNLDMIGRNEEVPDPADPRFRGMLRMTAAENRNVVHLIGYSYSPELSKLIDEENEAVGLTIKRVYDTHEQNLLRRSDHWSFLERGIPAAFFITGLHPDYHTPDDDVDKLNFVKMEKITRLVYRVAWQLAQREAPVKFVDPE
jgi:Zn-dependent M28 family amino/carboxypeptidase